jgi:hypothetical protein
MIKPASQTVASWLKSNLGKTALAATTGTDYKALLAAVQIIELYSYDRDPSLLGAFGHVVRRMQPSQYSLAYHAIAHVMDWSDRFRVWQGAGLPTDIKVRRCAFEPQPVIA